MSGHIHPRFITPGAADWKAVYEAALLETDRNKLGDRIVAARTAILDRVEECLTRSEQTDQIAMNNALRTLRRLAARLDIEPAA
jgi:hypothetical protein